MFSTEQFGIYQQTAIVNNHLPFFLHNGLLHINIFVLF